MAGLEAHVGHFTSPTSTDSSFSVTGVGFQPKAVIFFPTRRTATGADTATDMIFGIGAMTETDMVVHATNVLDNTASMSVTGYYYTNYCLVYPDSGNTTNVLGEAAAYVSMDADGFTLNYSAVDGVGNIVQYLALGGSKLEVACGQMTTGFNTVPHDYTSPSLGFAPKGYIQFTSEYGNEPQVRSQTSRAMLYGATSATEYFCMSQYNEYNVARSDTGRGQTNAYLAQQQFDAGNSFSGYTAEHKSFNADDYTYTALTYSDPPNTTPIREGFIAFGGEGIDCKWGDFTLNTSGASQSVTVETGFKPNALLFLGTDLTSNAAANDLVNICGLSDGTNHRGYAVAMDDNSANSEPTTYVSNTYCLLSQMTVTTGAIAAEADISSFDTNGFTIGHNSNPATAYRLGYFAINYTPTPSLPDTVRRNRMRAHLAR